MLVVSVINYLKSRLSKRELIAKKLVETHEQFPSANLPSVTIVIPTRDKVELLRSCVESLLATTDYPDMEIVVVDNQSTKFETMEYLDDLGSRGIKILSYDNPFNFSAICNFAARSAETELICFLNNDTEVIQSSWLRHMVAHMAESDVSLVGARLEFPDSTVQHMGIVRGFRGVAGHIQSAPSVYSEERPLHCFEVTAVTFACALVSKEQYLALGGLDEGFKVGLNDVDYGIRNKNIGKRGVICINSTLIHHESQSRPTMFSLRGSVTAVLEVIRFFRKHPGTNQDDYFCERA